MVEIISYEQFEQSYKRYRDYVENIFSADHKDFHPHLRIFLKFFEADIIFKPIAQQIKSHPKVDIDVWWGKVQASTGSFVGSGDFDLPDEENERLSLLYQLSMAVNTGKISLDSIAMSLFHGRKLDDWVDKFNDRILRPMFKLLDYKIDDIEKQLRKQHKRSDKISEKEYRTYVDQSIHIDGDVYGNVATGNATIIDNKIIINNDSELIKALYDLKEDLDKGKPEQKSKEQAEELIEELIELVKKNGDKVQAAGVTDRLVKICPWLKEKLGKIAIAATASVIAEGIVQGIKFVVFGA